MLSDSAPKHDENSRSRKFSYLIASFCLAHLWCRFFSFRHILKFLNWLFSDCLERLWNNKIDECWGQVGIPGITFGPTRGQFTGGKGGVDAYVLVVYLKNIWVDLTMEAQYHFILYPKLSKEANLHKALTTEMRNMGQLSPAKHHLHQRTCFPPVGRQHAQKSAALNPFQNNVRFNSCRWISHDLWWVRFGSAVLVFLEIDMKVAPACSE